MTVTAITMFDIAVLHPAFKFTAEREKGPNFFLKGEHCVKIHIVDHKFKNIIGNGIINGNFTHQ